jgi:polysaccharide export outer membrane protein
MINKLFGWGAILAIGLQLAGCYTDYGPVVADSVPVAATDVALRVQPGDELKVLVFGEDALSGLYEITPAGTVSLPLIGTIIAAGHTRAELERIITRAYAAGKFLQEPKITVSVVSYQPFYIFGEVTLPGQYPFKSGLDVLTAVATAKGFTYRASRTSVLIRHPGQKVWQEYSLAAPVAVAPGDLIRVPERYF